MRTLSRQAQVFRLVHASIAGAFLSAIAYVWWCGLTGRRSRTLTVAIASLAGEGILVAANGGDCPLGPLQNRLDDPTPLFELVLSPRAAKAAVPVLGTVAGAGAALVLIGDLRRSGRMSSA